MFGHNLDTRFRKKLLRYKVQKETSKDQQGLKSLSPNEMQMMPRHHCKENLSGNVIQTYGIETVERMNF